MWSQCSCVFTLYHDGIIMTSLIELSILFYRLILEREGPRSLFRGLGPNLVGVAPSRYWQWHQQYSLFVANQLCNFIHVWSEYIISVIRTSMTCIQMIKLYTQLRHIFLLIILAFFPCLLSFMLTCEMIVMTCPTYRNALTDWLIYFKSYRKRAGLRSFFAWPVVHVT